MNELKTEVMKWLKQNHVPGGVTKIDAIVAGLPTPQPPDHADVGRVLQELHEEGRIVAAYGAGAVAELQYPIFVEKVIA